MNKNHRFGDRKDGRLLRNLDSLHFITAILYPNRCDNEAYISERIDLTNLNRYLEEKNAANPEYRYNLFQVIVAALGKTITLRPKLNRFIANCNFYQRNEVTASFVVKKTFDDKGAEALAVLHFADDDTMDTVHEKIYHQIADCRSEKVDSSTDSMNFFNSMPRWLSKAIVRIIVWLDRHGWVPSGLVETDPYYCSAVISNLGSIKLKCGYHHLTNWGTCSLFCIVGEIGKTPVYHDDGSFEMRETVDLGLTVDERLADGFYYSQSVRLLKTLLENPALLDKPMIEEIHY